MSVRVTSYLYIVLTKYGTNKNRTYTKKKLSLHRKEYSNKIIICIYQRIYRKKSCSFLCSDSLNVKWARLLGQAVLSCRREKERFVSIVGINVQLQYAAHGTYIAW